MNLPELYRVWFLRTWRTEASLPCTDPSAYFAEEMEGAE